MSDGLIQARLSAFLEAGVGPVSMIVGSLLTKHLLIGWQHGARWFWDTLVDADLEALMNKALTAYDEEFKDTI